MLGGDMEAVEDEAPGSTNSKGSFGITIRSSISSSTMSDDISTAGDSLCKNKFVEELVRTGSPSSSSSSISEGMEDLRVKVGLNKTKGEGKKKKKKKKKTFFQEMVSGLMEL